jgi:hypothetical protein
MHIAYDANRQDWTYTFIEKRTQSSRSKNGYIHATCTRWYLYEFLILSSWFHRLPCMSRSGWAGKRPGLGRGSLAKRSHHTRSGLLMIVALPAVSE